MPFTDEQRRKALETRMRNKAAKATAVAEPDLDADDDDVLSQLASTILKARDKKANQRKVLEDLAKILDQIDPKEHPEIADDPTIGAFLEKIGEQREKRAREQGLRPGSVIGNPNSLTAAIVSWTYGDLDKYVTRCGCANPPCGISPCPNGIPDLKTWTPNETIPVFWNGLRCQLIADQEVTAHSCFYNEYMEHKRLQRDADQRKAYIFGRTATPPAGDGGEAVVAMSRARAFMSISGEGGGGRMVVGYPGDARFELRDVPGGGEPVSGETPAQ